MIKKISEPLRVPSWKSEPTQDDKIIECLRARRPRWVAMPHLSAISGSLNVHTRIDKLRKKGFVIDNEQRTKAESRTRDSFYRLVSEPNEATEEKNLSNNPTKEK